ncbi:hypothetical protein ACFLU5_06830 [Bacteroidota bacterium]
MKNITSFCAIMIVICSIIFSCKFDKQISTEEIETLRIEYDSLLTAADSAWYHMMADDDEKIFYMKRLLQEVSYTYMYDSVVYAGLMSRVEELEKIRYTRESMKDGNLIDKYDNLTGEVIHEVIRFASSHPNYANYPLMGELIMEINEMDGEVLLYRVNYDSAAHAYNQFLDKHASNMDTIVPEGGYAKLAMFAIIEEAA